MCCPVPLCISMCSSRIRCSITEALWKTWTFKWRSKKWCCGTCVASLPRNQTLPWLGWVVQPLLPGGDFVEARTKKSGIYRVYAVSHPIFCLFMVHTTRKDETLLEDPKKRQNTCFDQKPHLRGSSDAGTMEHLPPHGAFYHPLEYILWQQPPRNRPN